MRPGRLAAIAALWALLLFALLGLAACTGPGLEPPGEPSNPFGGQQHAGPDLQPNAPGVATPDPAGMPATGDGDRGGDGDGSSPANGQGDPRPGGDGAVDDDGDAGVDDLSP